MENLKEYLAQAYCQVCALDQSCIPTPCNVKIVAWYIACMTPGDCMSSALLIALPSFHTVLYSRLVAIMIIIIIVTIHALYRLVIVMLVMSGPVNLVR